MILVEDRMFPRIKFEDLSSWVWVCFVLWSIFGLLIYFRLGGGWVCLLPGFVAGGFLGWEIFKDGTYRFLKTFVIALLSAFGGFGIFGVCSIFWTLFFPG
jgi:hypothetical protein